MTVPTPGIGSPTVLQAIDIAAESIAEKGLAKFLSDSECASEIARLLRDEFRIPPSVTKLILKSILPLALKRATSAGSWASEIGRKQVAQRLERLPGAKAVLSALAVTLERIDKDVRARKEFDAALSKRRAGRSAPDDRGRSQTPDTQNLSRDLRADLEILATLDQTDRAHDQRFCGLEEAVNVLLHELSPQPPLRLRELPFSDQTRFQYGARSTLLVGRDAELAALDAFLDASAMMRWWVITGPGGMGKSRLALELALRHGTAARIGFLRWPWDVAWDIWQPDRPTVVIVDYAESLQSEVRSALVRLSERSDLSFPVRMLLLARHAGDGSANVNCAFDGRSDPQSRWLEQLMGRGHSRRLLLESRHDTPLELRPLDDDALASVAASFLPSAISADVKMNLAREVARLDPQRRPLFAAFAGDALARGGDIREWSRSDLIENIRREDELFWTKQGVSSNERDLLAIATVCGGISATDYLKSAEYESHSTDPVDPARYSTTTGVRWNERFLPLEPDLMGEYFVLERFTPTFADEWRPWEIIRRSVAFSAKGTASFLERAAADFPEHRSITQLARVPPTSIAPAHEAVSVIAALTNGFVLAGHYDPLKKAHDAVTELHQSEPGLAIARDFRAVSAANLSLTAGMHGFIEAAVDAYRELVEVAGSRLDEARFRELRAEVADDLTIDLANHGDCDRLADLLTEFDALFQQNPTETRLRNTWSRIAYHWLFLAGGSRRFDKTRPVLRRLLRVAAEAPHDAILAQRAARAARNLLIDYLGPMDSSFASADSSGAIEQYRAIRLLARTHREDPEIVQQFFLAAEAMHRFFASRRDGVRSAAIASDALQIRPAVRLRTEVVA